ncbi:MAG: MarR family transcriptional regulator [Saprospiraceae bacterium]|nr:MarR family transcriptional regulator [Saprospiraceae bacterium]
MIFIANHAKQMATVSYLALEFHVTKATISDAVRVLEQKQLLEKTADKNDARSFFLQLTKKGRTIISQSADFAQSFPISDPAIFCRRKELALGPDC